VAEVDGDPDGNAQVDEQGREDEEVHWGIET
jgi:hypothetical protein